MTDSQQTPHIVPYLSYDDAPAAIDFLTRAFGFEEHYRLHMPDGKIGHAELRRGNDAIMLASTYEQMGFKSPLHLDGCACQIHCSVDDVDAHYERAKAAGATVFAEPEDQFYGERIYRATDPEGHRWIFSTRVREVSVDEMKQAIEQMG